MRAKTLIVAVMVVGAVCLWSPRISMGAMTITFDDATPMTGGSLSGQILDGYAGFRWDHFWAWDVTHEVRIEGAANCRMSGDCIAFTPLNAVAAMYVTDGSRFNFFGGYVNAMSSQTPMHVDVIGYRSGQPVYADTVVVDSSPARWFNFNFMEIDRLTFRAWGASQGHNQIGMEDLSAEHVPEPATLSLLALAGLAMLRRNRKGA